MPASRTTTTDLRGRRRRRTGPRRILALALTAVALTPAAAVAHPADATDAPRAARAHHPAGLGDAVGPAAKAAAPADPDTAPPEPVGGGTSWATIALAGLGACLAGAGAVVGAERRLRVRHSRIPA